MNGMIPYYLAEEVHGLLHLFGNLVLNLVHVPIKISKFLLEI